MLSFRVQVRPSQAGTISPEVFVRREDFSSPQALRACVMHLIRIALLGDVYLGTTAQRSGPVDHLTFYVLVL